ncbi:MAG: DUF2807 domain-containing protein [Dehalococcoidales bacterium]|nr:MAG: DUF2807 domain-containing protein [Dehalococcoidales bacterium]
MKKGLIPVILILTLVAVPMLPGCSGSIGTGEVITEKKDFSNFTSLDISSAFEVDITQSSTYSVVISADESLFDYIEVTQTGSQLKIYLSPRHIFTDFTLGKRVLKAEISMASLHELNISGASKGTVTGFRSASPLKLIVSGATTLELSNIGAGDTDCEVSGASKLTGNLTIGNVDFIVSGASSMEVSGVANDMEIEISGASRVDLEQFHVGNVDVILSGASEATVYVNEVLNLEVSGASRLYFAGNPQLGKTNVSGASTIKHKD